ncbi:V4R domain-containing protein [Methanocaldococcus infernus]
MSVSATRIVRMLEIIDNKAKFMGIKLTMIRNLLERYKNNKELIKEILKLTEGKRLYDLILEACPELKEVVDEIKYEEIYEEEKEIIKEEIESFRFENRISLMAYIKDHLRDMYFGTNSNKIFYEIGKNYALKCNIKSYKEMEELIKEEFGEVDIIKDDKDIKVIIRDNKEAKNYVSSEPVCCIASGVISGCLESIYNKEFIVDVFEEKCIAKGDEYCLFIAKKSRKLIRELFDKY